MGQSLRNRTSTILPFPTRLTPDSDASAVRVAVIPETQREAQAFADGTLCVDWNESRVEYRGVRASMLRVEMQLLGALLAAKGSVVSRAAMIQAAWPHADTQSRENSLAVYVCGLRKRLATIGLPAALQTVRREGYRLQL